LTALPSTNDIRSVENKHKKNKERLMNRCDLTVRTGRLLVGLALLASCEGNPAPGALDDGADGGAIASDDSDAGGLTGDSDADMAPKATATNIPMPKAIVDDDDKLIDAYYTESVNKELFSWKNVVLFNASKPASSAVPIMYLTHVASSKSNFGMNSYRSAGNRTALTYSDTLAGVAKKRANTVLEQNKSKGQDLCTLQHLPFTDGIIGENAANAESPYDAVHLWASEKLTYKDGKCHASSTTPYTIELPLTTLGRGHVKLPVNTCGHYDAIMNSNAKSIGCGSSDAVCQSGTKRKIQICVFK
jgi:hypothetical protein